MEKGGELPPSYEHQGYGYTNPQAPPSYQQSAQQPAPQQAYPTQQQYPPPGVNQTQYSTPQTYQQYPNVVVQQPMFANPATSPPPPDHMTAAIFATLCCFWPTGIVAIIKANDAKSAWMRGDSALAHANARSAKTMVNVSIIAGICSFILLAVIIGIYVGVVVNNYNSYDDDYYD